MKNYFFTVIIFFNLFAHRMLESSNLESSDIIVSEFCELYYLRCYFIWRIEKIIMLFISFEKNKRLIDFDTIILKEDESRFFHPRIAKMISAIQEQKTLSSLFETWDYLRRYKSLDDTGLMQDFIKAILVISANIFFQLSQKNDTSKKIADMYYHVLSVSSLVQLGYAKEFALCINAMLTGGTCLLETMYRNLNAQIIKSDNALDSIKNFIMPYKQWQLNGISYTEAITHRYYYCRRLEAAIELLAKLAKKKKLLDACFSAQPFYSNKEKKTFFTQKCIIDCLKQVKREKTVIPILRLWQEVKACHGIDNHAFSHEFSFLLLLVFNQILMYVSKDRSSNKISTQQMVQTYQQLESLPLEEMLNTIDLLTTELPKLIEQYEINTKMSWQKWIEKYWWRFPVEVVKLLFKVLLSMRPRPSMFYPYYYNDNYSHNHSSHNFSLLDDYVK